MQDAQSSKASRNAGSGMGGEARTHFGYSEVPLAEMFGYATAIRSLSKGRCSYSMEPSHFEQVPENVKNAVLDQKAK